MYVKVPRGTREIEIMNDDSTRSYLIVISEIELENSVAVMIFENQDVQTKICKLGKEGVIAYEMEFEFESEDVSAHVFKDHFGIWITHK